MKRYEQLAGDIAEAIANGSLPPGAKLPSVRQTSASRGVSPSTVFQAYYLLEGRGLIHARPRSGYYVAPIAGKVPEPEPSRPSGEQQDVEVSELVFQVFEHMRDRDLLALGSAFPDPSLFPLDKLALAQSKAMRHLDPWRTVEHLSPGHPELRRQITLRYLATAFAIDPNELVVTNGAMEALNLSLEAVTQPGDLVAVESPSFYGALQALEHLKLRALEVPTHPRTGVDVQALARLLAQHPVKACWFMPNFQNPLGSLMPEPAKQALVRLLAEHQIPLIEDDVYGELYFGARKPWPAKAWDSEGLVLHCSSFSKTLAPGYRIGWVAAGRFTAALARRKLMGSLTAAVPSQEALSRYLEQGSYDRHLRQLRLDLQGKRSVALHAIAEHFPAGTRVSPPEGGYFLWVELPPQVDALALHRLGLARRVSSAPGHLFSADHRFAHHLRINFGQADATQLDAALKLLGALAKSLAHATPDR